MPTVDPHQGHDQDDDPTGVRSLLSGLPDPGPMPEHLVQRIQTRLEVEREHLSGSTTHPLTGSADRVVDLAAERGRRRPGRTLGLLTAAAAGLAITTVTLTQLLGGAGTGDSGALAQYPSRAESGDTAGAGAAEDLEGADDSAGGAQEDAAGADGARDGATPDSEESGASEQSADLGALSEVAPPTVVPDLGMVVRADYTARMVQVTTSDVAPDVSSSLTPTQAAQCWAGVGPQEAARWEERFAAPARLRLGDDEQDVVVLLGRAADGTGHAWLMPRSCTQRTEVPPIEPEGDPVGAP